MTEYNIPPSYYAAPRTAYELADWAWLAIVAALAVWGMVA